MSNSTYDKLKFFTTLILPALGTLYFALSQIWGLPYGEQVVGTVTAVVTFLSVCLKISTNQYNKKMENIIESVTEDVDDAERL